MKNVLCAVAVLMTTTAALAADVTGARLDKAGKNIEVDVRYSGGCQEHQFQLQMQGCLETMPVQCSVKLIDVTPELDMCEAIVGKTVTFNLSNEGLNESYYAGANLSISGDGPLRAVVKLPNVLPLNENQDGQLTCKTHTGADLQINTTQKKVSLKAANGQQAEYEITKVDAMSIETYPAIDQTTYSLNDGRKIVTEFRNSDDGIGYWIRTGGEASPEFTCKK